VKKDGQRARELYEMAAEQGMESAKDDAERLS
jgi:TPR repeat protein